MQSRAPRAHPGSGEEAEAGARMAGLLEAGLELGPMAVLITVPGDRTIERANAAARTLYRGDPTGRPLGDVLPEIAREIDAEGPASSLALVTRTEHMDLQLADGTWSPVEVWVQMVAGGRLLVIARDLTEMVENQRRALRLARDERARAAELRAVIETMDDAVMLFDWSGAVTLANDAARYLVGGTFATYEQLVAAVGPAEGEMPSLTLSPEHATIHGGRSDRWHEVSVRRIFDEGEVESESSYLVVVHDATAAQELAAAHEAFVGVLAHELRTPVTTIFGNARLLRTAGAVAPEEQTEVLADIEVEADRLHRLIEDLLVLSRAEREILAVDGEPVDLSRVLRATAEAELRRWPGVRLALDVPDRLPAVSAEPTYVEQIARNIIGNAAKYSGRDGEIIVRARRDGDAVEVRVLDTGPGFRAEEAPHLFELFYRAPSTAGQRAGSGIGLFVARKLAEAMGGRVWACGRDSGGSEFGFALRVATADLE